MTHKKRTIFLLVLALAAVAVLTYFFLPKLLSSTAPKEIVPTSPEDRALIEVTNYVHTLPEYNSLPYSIIIAPSSLGCADCFVGVLTITNTQAEKYFDIRGTVVTQSSDGANLVR